MKNLTKPPSKYTLAYYREFCKDLPFDDRRDFEWAQRGFMGTIDAGGIFSGEDCIWNLRAYDFENLDQPCPDTVNPSLWRQAQLNHIHGLFEVVPGVYQLRGFDMANMTVIEGDSGIVVVDTLKCVETAKAAIELYYEHRGRRAVKAIIYTHCHTGHYGGVKALVSEEDVACGRVPVYAPEGFLPEAVSENALVGNAVARRAMYMCGPTLRKGPRYHVDIGMGKGAIRGGTISLIAPSHILAKKFTTLILDGLAFEFIQTPFTEAPAEMILYLPKHELLMSAENVTHSLHNLLSPRGGQVRDARLWWKCIDDMLERYGSRTSVICAAHHWPVWGNGACVELLRTQRDTYKYIHDQCVRLMNHGLSAAEIAEQLELPPAIGNQWSVRGYYGTLNHDAKAVYQKYLGWFDMNPANYHALPPGDAAQRYVQLAGGRNALLKQVQSAHDAGEYRWAAELGKHLVFAFPDDDEVLLLLADVYEQLGYQTESGAWRSIYLSGAYELRLHSQGMLTIDANTTVNPDILNAMTDELLYDFTASRLNGPKAWNANLVIEITQSDRDVVHSLRVKNGVLNFHQGKRYEHAGARLSLTRSTLSRLVLHETSLAHELNTGNVLLSGDDERAHEFFALLDIVEPGFNIALP